MPVPWSPFHATLLQANSHLSPDVTYKIEQLTPNKVPVAQHGAVVAGDLANGPKLYAANCASCHGAKGEGSVGPELHGENMRKDAAGTIKAVDDVASYVESLRPGIS